MEGREDIFGECREKFWTTLKVGVFSKYFVKSISIMCISFLHGYFLSFLIFFFVLRLQNWLW